MCGIVGIINKDKEAVNGSLMQNMVACLGHRGPDDSGVHIDKNIGLGHSRLSIIDLSKAGHQPMHTADGRYTIVFNGEIYNFAELRDKYCNNVELRSTSDTEVLVNLLALKGKGVLSELKGMFALAMWDKVNRVMLLACDPFGKKPIYYIDRKEFFLFGSEVKSLLVHPKVQAVADKKALAQYLLYEYVPGEATGFEQIKRLEMGSYMEIDSAGKKKKEKWWEPKWEPKKRTDWQTAQNEMDVLLRQSVKRRLIADVPVGVLLSGGIDSTTIAWYMKSIGAADLHSFSVSFQEGTFDESAYARQAAHAVGAEHHNVVFGLEEFKSELDRVVKQIDIPFGDSSLLPTRAVCALAKERVSVVLDGDGSDELLGGYGVWQAAEMADKLPQLPRNWWSLLEKGAKLWPTKLDYFSFDFKIKSFLQGLGLDLPVRHQVWMGSFDKTEMLEILSPQLVEYVEEVFGGGSLKNNEELSVFDRISAQTIQDYLQNDILVKLDRASMMVSLEARTPFLDVDFAEFVMKLPMEMKREKKILRSLMKGRIPDSIIDRPKQGFAMPLGHWLKQPLYEWAQQVLSREKVEAGGMLKYEVVQRLLEDHRRGRADNRKKLWTILMLSLWWEKWIG